VELARKRPARILHHLNFDGFVQIQPSAEVDGFSTSTIVRGALREGKALVNPLDVEGIPNLTWTGLGRSQGAGEIPFSARTKTAGTLVASTDRRWTRPRAHSIPKSHGIQGSAGSAHHHAELKKSDSVDILAPLHAGRAKTVLPPFFTCSSLEGSGGVKRVGPISSKRSRQVIHRESGDAQEDAPITHLHKNSRFEGSRTMQTE